MSGPAQITCVDYAAIGEAPCSRQVNADTLSTAACDCATVVKGARTNEVDRITAGLTGLVTTMNDPLIDQG
ncbi:MAG: hypothetical protein B7Z67_00020 [Acidiphilium sp. 21-60-14]|nr:MAG: hypothetical protein B7Z67_00020 [Acidiphilium sp. 21-60-14]OZB40546.1 MAG: hypothetical protein B7X48_04035 [Acidiphilium sp. 34-60-192]